jgi:hypothetical protein
MSNHEAPMNNISNKNDSGFSQGSDQDRSFRNPQPDPETNKGVWASPELRQYGKLSFVVKGAGGGGTDFGSELSVS